MASTSAVFALKQVPRSRALQSFEPEPPNTRLRRSLATGDAVAGMLAWSIPLFIPGSLLAEAVTKRSAADVVTLGLSLLAFGLITITVMAMHRLYRARVSSMRTVEISRIGQSSFVLGVVAIVLGRVIGEIHLVRFPVFVAVGAFVLLNLWRVIFSTWLNAARRDDRFTRSVLLVGANDEGEALYRHLRRHPELGYRVRGIVGQRDQAITHGFEEPWLGEISSLQQILDETGLKGAFVAGSAISRPELNIAVRQLLKSRVHVHMSTGINGIDHRRMQSHALAYEPMVYVERAQLEGWQTAMKRAMDVAIAATLLLITSPVLAVAAAAIKIYDRGPVFFRQKRVGRNGTEFTMLKLRSMCTDAERKLIDLSERNVRQGPLFKMDVDPRVTPVGRIIRALSIDELPQLMNVLRGDMSMVGPRPALPSEVEKFDDALLARHDVRPGITGLWQVEARDNPDFAIYQRLDIFYVENWSVALDLSILLGTAKVVILHAVAAFHRARTRRTFRQQVADNLA